MTQTYMPLVSIPPLDPPVRLLMGPGPSNPDPRVLAAMSKRLVGHLDPYFVELMDQAIIARVFSFRYASRVSLENEDLRITRQDRDAPRHLERVLDDLARQEIVNTGVISTPDVRFYPVSIDRFIREILDQEFGG